MAGSHVRAHRVWIAVAFLFSGILTAVVVRPADAQITGVTGSAFGYQLNVSLFNGPNNAVGPVPRVTLPAGGSSTPVTATEPTGLAEVSPATFFSSGQIEVSTQGTPQSGSVTSSARITNINTSQSEIFTASALSSTCTATGTGVSGSTTITRGTLQTDSGDDANNNVPNHPATTVDIPAEPAPNTEFTGHLHVGNVQDNFRVVFNEQIRNPDGSLTVNAVHQYFQGDIARGDLIIGQVVCGVTGTAQTTTTAAPGATTTTAPGATTTTAPGATTTSAPGATTTTAPGATTTTAQATTTTAQATTTTAQATTTSAPTTTGVAGGAYGYYVSVSLFGGAANTRGPAPTVTLPSGGSATPITETLGSATAQFGPATLFSSDQLEVSTQGTPGGTVTSSARVTNVNRSGQEQLTAATASSTCSASGSGETGSVTLTGGRLTTSSGSNFDSEADDTIVDLPGSPAPNTSFRGAIENVGDTFEVVLNEQIRSAGSITVNAVHMRLLGPTARGEVIIGQVVCSTTGGGGGGSGSISATGTVTGGGGGGLATSGGAIAVFFASALVLVVGGSTTTYWVAGVRWPERSRRRMPWATGRLLR